LNAVYEYECSATDRELMSQIENNMTFKEGQRVYTGNANGSNDSMGDIDSNSSSSHHKSNKINKSSGDHEEGS